MSMPTPGAITAKVVIRIVLAVLGVFAALSAGVAAVLVWAFTTSLVKNGSGIATIMAILVAFLAPVILFTVVSNTQAMIGASKRLRVWGYVSFCFVEAAAIMLVIVAGYQTQPWTWLPTTIVAMSVLFSGVAVLLGRLLRSPAAPTHTDAGGELVLGPWAPEPARSPRSVLLATAIVFVGVTVLALAGGWSLIQRSSVHGFSPFVVVGALTALDLGFLVAFFVVLFAWFPSAMRLANVLPRSPARRRIVRAVWRNTPDALTPVEFEFARRYASVATSTTRWMLLAFGLLFAGIESEQIGQAIEPHSFIGPWGAIVFGAIYVALIVGLVVQHRRIRRFAELHGTPTSTPVVPDSNPEPLPA